MTRMERRRQRRIEAIYHLCVFIVLVAMACLISIWVVRHNEVQAEVETHRIVYHEDGKDLPDYCEAPLKQR